MSLTAQQGGSGAVLQSSSECAGSSAIDFETIDVDYLSLQYSMMITVLVEVLGAFFFFMNAWYKNNRVYFLPFIERKNIYAQVFGGG